MGVNPKVLTVEGWKTVSTKCRLDKDLQKVLQRELGILEGLSEDEFDARSKCCGRLVSLAGELTDEDAVSSNPLLVTYLKQLVTAAKEEQRGLAAASKTAASEEEEESEAEDDEAEDEGELGGPEQYSANLKKKLDMLKTAAKPFPCVYCEATPVGAVGLDKNRVGPKQREQLTVVTGGGKRFYKGSVTRQGMTLTFVFDKDVSKGLANKILRSIKYFTDRKYRIALGDEVAEDPTGTGEEPTAGAGAAGSASEAGPAVRDGRPDAQKPTLQKAPQIWGVTQRLVQSKIEQLKTTVMQTFAAEGPELVREVERNMTKLDAVFEKLDDDLAEHLQNANGAADEKTRNDELKAAKALLADHIRFVKSEPMIAHIDSNPFGVQTNLQASLMKSLRLMVEAIGDKR